MATNISYGRSEDAWRGYEQFIMALIDKHNIKRVCDIGAGANPLLNSCYIAEKNIDYSILDVSNTQLGKAPTYCKKILADIAAPDFSTCQKFDLVFSKMLAEHIADAEQFHRNVLKMLANDGLAVHFFPTLYALPFLVNSLVPEYLAAILLNLFAPRDTHQYPKFQAYYRLCRGPIRSQIERLSRLGYDVVEYRGFFGHGGYYNKVKILKKLHEFKTNYLLKNPNPFFTSYAYVVLKKV